MIDRVCHLLFLLLLPPLLLGVVTKTKAFYAGRVGAPLFQRYYDICKLLRRGMVISSTTTWIFRAGPVVTLAAVLVAGALVPLGSSPALVSFTGDFLLFAYLFGLARFFTTSAALDTGSAFEGMGAAREVTFAVLTEPAMFFGFLVLARLSASLSLAGMLQSSSVSLASPAGVAPVVMVLLGLFIVFLAENCRIPVDDPTTHLELTMIHEVMVLDHSGPLLAVIEYAAALKFMILGVILVNILVPAQGFGGGLNWLVLAAALVGLAFVVGTVESVIGRLRMSRVPFLLVVAVLLCGSAFVILLR